MEITEQEMQKLGIEYRIRQGAIKMLMQLNEWGYIPKKPKVEVGKKNTQKNNNDFVLYAIYNQCLQDSFFLESFLMEEEMIYMWGKEEIKGKWYKTLRLVPKSRTKTLIVEIKE